MNLTRSRWPMLLNNSCLHYSFKQNVSAPSKIPTMTYIINFDHLLIKKYVISFSFCSSPPWWRLGGCYIFFTFFFVIYHQNTIFALSSRRWCTSVHRERPRSRVVNTGVVRNHIWKKRLFALCSWRLESLGNSQFSLSKDTATIDAHGYVIYIPWCSVYIGVLYPVDGMPVFLLYIIMCTPGFVLYIGVRS